jgi:hypothetical protein
MHGIENSINVYSLLSDAISDSDPTPVITLSTGDGIKFADIPVPFYVILALADETEMGDDSVVEAMEVEEVDGDTLIISERALSNTTAHEWNIGDKVRVDILDLNIKEIHDDLDAIRNGEELTNDAIAPDAAIDTSKLAEGGMFLRSDGAVAFANDQDADGYTIHNLSEPALDDDPITKAYFEEKAVMLEGSVMEGDLDLDGNLIKNSGAPEEDDDLTPLGVVQSADRLNPAKVSAEWTTTGDISLSGLDTQLNGEWTTSLSGGERILVKDQTSPLQNGIYIAASIGWERAPDASISEHFDAGMIIQVRKGATYANTWFYCSNIPPVNLDTDPIEFTQFTVPDLELPIEIEIGGTGLTDLGNANEVLAVNGAGTSLEYISTVKTGIEVPLSKSVKITEGLNGVMGTATLSSGSVVVTTNRVTANSRIFLTAQTTGANMGHIYVSTRTGSVNFTISSTNGSDDRVVAWLIIEPA